eukprot:XP_001701367.1 predicted protein [Chlamydomonas reinhardtii]
MLSDRTSGSFALDLLPSRSPTALKRADAAAKRRQLLGVASLLVTAFLWGSYSPVLKLLFSGPSPPSAALMTAAQRQPRRPAAGGVGRVGAGGLVAAGLELGLYNFGAVAFGTWGVQRLSATKVAFLGQATSLMTPLLVAASGQRVARVVWLACMAGALPVLRAGHGGARADAAEVGRLLRDWVSLACVLWAGFGPGALSSYLQMLGQRIMLYSTTPLWSALLARLLLHGSDGAMGPLAWLGGGVMLGQWCDVGCVAAAGRRCGLTGRGDHGGAAGPVGCCEPCQLATAVRTVEDR